MKGYWYDHETGGTIMGDVSTGEIMSRDPEPPWPAEDQLVNMALTFLENDMDELAAHTLEAAALIAWALGR